MTFKVRCCKWTSATNQKKNNDRTQYSIGTVHAATATTPTSVYIVKLSRSVRLIALVFAKKCVLVCVCVCLVEVVIQRINSANIVLCASSMQT